MRGDVPDIFDEVSEDLRADRARILFRRYGILLGILAVLIVLGVAGYEAWSWRKKQQDAAVSDAFVTALREAAGTSAAAAPDQVAHARAALDQIAATGPEGYATLARMRGAALRADAGDKAGAVALWEQVASLQAIRLQLDDGNPASLEARLAPLRDPGSAWHGLADETQALLDIRTGKTDDAKAILRGLLSDASTPQPVRARANFLLQRLGV
jgi:hypothetical protein